MAVATIAKPDNQLSPRENASIRSRMQDLLELDIDFVPNPEFREAGDREEIGCSPVDTAADSTTVRTDLPAHLSRMCEQELLTQEQETALFREMNYLKFRADKLRDNLDPSRVDPQAIEIIESLLANAQEIRDHIIKANMRLVVSIVKKFVTPQQSFDEMLSDGIVTLMQAVEKFDYDRGFRFSTYAYRSIARSAFRAMTSAHKEEARFTRGAEDWAFEQVDERNSSSLRDQVWSNLRELAMSMLDNLDRRERFIIRSRYALGAHRKVRSFQYLADKLGVSKERARQLEKRAVGKLRNMAAEFEMDELFGAALV